MAGISSHDRYQVRVATSPHEVEAAQRLRQDAFCMSSTGGRDEDPFDTRCQHFLIECQADRRLVGTFRVLSLGSGADIQQSYSAQFYDLSRLTAYPGPMAEVGRFCIVQDETSPDILRTAWGALTRFVDREQIAMLFGCSSFPGTDERLYEATFDILRDRHLAPPRFAPGIKAEKVVQFSNAPAHRVDHRHGLKRMPSLLRSYLAMGGWVSDHAVVDHQMNTLHVFTGLEIERIPAARARVLRAVAAERTVDA